MPIVSLAVRSKTPLAARADDVRRPQGEAAPREHRRRRQGEPGRRLDPRGHRRSRPGDALGPRHGRRRGGRGPVGREREHAARPPDAGRHRDAAPHLGQAAGHGRLRVDGHRPPRRPADPASARSPTWTTRSRSSATLALVNGEPAVAIDILKQTKANTVAVVDAVHRRGRDAAGRSCRPASRSRSCATARCSSASRSPTS